MYNNKCLIVRGYSLMRVFETFICCLICAINQGNYGSVSMIALTQISFLLKPNLLIYSIITFCCVRNSFLGAQLLNTGIINRKHDPIRLSQGEMSSVQLTLCWRAEGVYIEDVRENSSNDELHSHTHFKHNSSKIRREH